MKRNNKKLENKYFLNVDFDSIIKEREVELTKLKELRKYQESRLKPKKRIKNSNIVDIKYIGVPNICFSITDPDDEREEEFSKERRNTGFDTSELWNLFHTIAQFILPRLRAYRECTGGYPGWCSNFDEWACILDKMIRSFELVVREEDYMSNDEQDEWEEGMKLFCEHFFSLWY